MRIIFVSLCTWCSKAKTLTGTVNDACAAAPLPSGRTPDGKWPPDRQVACYWPFHKPLADLGVDGWWPDQGDDLDPPSRLARIRMYFEGQQLYRPGKRVYALHRNGYAGMQRYAAFLWSGDVLSTWETLKTHVPVGINTGLSGIPFWGTDIGGFIPTQEYTGELYRALVPVCGILSAVSFARPRLEAASPLGLGYGGNRLSGNAQLSSRAGRNSRSRHRAHLQKVSRAALSTHAVHLLGGEGDLRNRPADYARAVAALSRRSAGGGAGRRVSLRDGISWWRRWWRRARPAAAVYLPQGTWYDFWTREKHEGGREITRNVDLSTMPIYVRAGAVLPTGPVRQYTAEKVDGPLTLTVFPGAGGSGFPV